MCVCVFDLDLGWLLSQRLSKGISFSVCRLHKQPLLPPLLSFTFALDPQPIRILSHSSSHHSQSISPHTIAIFSIHYTLPSSSVCLLSWLVNSPAVLFFFTLYSLDFTCLFPPPPSLHPFLIQSIHTPRERYGSDEHREPGTNQSIDLSTYPSRCRSDRQQKTKCLLSETFPISFYPHLSPLRTTIHPHLVMESLFLGPVHPAETCRVFQLHFFTKVTPVRGPNFSISSPPSLPCPPLLPI